jgi:hypothetical protein
MSGIVVVNRNSKDIVSHEANVSKYTKVMANTIYRWQTIDSGCIPLVLVGIAYIKSINKFTSEYDAYLTGNNMSKESNKISIHTDYSGVQLGYKLECTAGIMRFQGTVDDEKIDIIMEAGSSIEFMTQLNGVINAMVQPDTLGQYRFEKFYYGCAQCGYEVKKLTMIVEDGSDPTPEVIPDPIIPTPEPEYVTYTVTFEVVNGLWNDNTSGNKSVVLSGTTAEGLYLSPDDIPGVGNYPYDGYEGGYWDNEPTTNYPITSDTIFTYTYQEIPESQRVEYTVTFEIVNGFWDDLSNETKHVTLVGSIFDTLTLDASDIPGAGNYPNDGYKEGRWNIDPDTETAITSDIIYIYSYDVISDSEPEPEEPTDTTTE